MGEDTAGLCGRVLEDVSVEVKFAMGAEGSVGVEAPISIGSQESGRPLGLERSQQSGVHEAERRDSSP